MRVALLIDELGATGGAETQVRLLLRSFDRARIDARLVLLRGGTPSAAEIGGCPVEQLGIGRLRSLDALRKSAAFGRRAREQGVALLWSFFFDASLLGWWVSRRIGVPLVLNQRNIGVGSERSRFERAVEGFVMRRCDGCAANSEAARAHAETRGVPQGRLTVIPNAVDTGRFRPFDPLERRQLRDSLGLPAQGALVGCVANHRPVKGIADLLRAFASLRERRPATLVLVGDGAQRPELEALARSLGVASAVAFLGRRTDVERIAPAFDVGVLPSHAEGSSNALLEWLACGTPAVATDVGGNAEALGDGERGVLVPARDPAALGEAISRLLDDTDRRHALAARGRAHVVAHFGPAQISLRWEQLFREVLARRTR